MTGEKIGFFRESIRDRHVAAVLPSSNHLVQRLMRHLDFSGIRTLVELGPGNGAATAGILKRLTPQARHLAVERNPHFAAALKRVDDPRLQVIEGDARELDALLDANGVNQADAVIASIPFTYLTDAERRDLVRQVKARLRPGGRFVVFYQHWPLMYPYLRREFSQVRVDYEPLNFLPCFLFSCTKG